MERSQEATSRAQGRMNSLLKRIVKDFSDVLSGENIGKYIHLMTKKLKKTELLQFFQFKAITESNQDCLMYLRSADISEIAAAITPMARRTTFNRLMSQLAGVPMTILSATRPPLESLLSKVVEDFADVLANEEIGIYIL